MLTYALILPPRAPEKNSLDRRTDKQKSDHVSVPFFFFLWYITLKSVSFCFQGRQREPSVKTLRSPLSAEFWRHCVLSCRNQRRAFASTPERKNGNINLSKYFISSSADRTHNQSVLQSHFMSLRHDCPQAYHKIVTQ